MERNKFFEYLFGDTLRYLFYNFRISPMLLPVLGLTALVYFLNIKKHKKGTKFTKKEKFNIGILIFMWILTIISQIAIIIQSMTGVLN
ncbi:MAG: hypothetical protein K6U80_01960 [Firmicutes bacterium]|nr:hypothetical protein [Bacillota bacterium]